MMEYEYASFRREIDFHNRCCGGMLWCIRDICGIICAILTWLLILYAEFVVMSVILIPSPYPFYSVINSVIFQCCAFLAFSSHLKTMFTDPVSRGGEGATRSRLACRELCQRGTPPRRWSSRWATGRARWYSSAQNAAVLSRTGPIIARSANGTTNHNQRQILSIHS